MNVCGEMFLGQRAVKGSGASFYAHNPSTSEKLEPVFFSGSSEDVERACALARCAFDPFRYMPLERRATFLETIADEILGLGDVLVQRAMAESGLPKIRIEGERGRTMGQLNMFAGVVRDGNWLDLRIDPAMPDRTPIPRPDLRLRKIPVGPVAVFGASNFPLAFSVAGGDTASAIAAGCPVIVKAHPAHPGTSELVARAIVAAAKKCGMPDGVFSLVFDSGHDLGKQLVSHAAVKAVGFTGSRDGGLALMKIAASRSEPIPVFAEMSSINPVFLLPGALKDSRAALADEFISSLTLGAGQFCTNPGLLIGLAGEDLNNLVDLANIKLTESAAQTMLTEGIYDAYQRDVGELCRNDAVVEESAGLPSGQPTRCQARLFSTTADRFLADERLQNEVFGAAALIVRCNCVEEMICVAEYLEGQLTATLQLSDEDTALASRLLPILERKAGRILCNAYPTGVEVCHAMVHGGPFPATSDGRTTSVGSAAISRFLRPVCYQGLPGSLLPTELQDENALGLRRLLDGSHPSETLPASGEER